LIEPAIEGAGAVPARVAYVATVSRNGKSGGEAFSTNFRGLQRFRPTRPRPPDLTRRAGVA